MKIPMLTASRTDELLTPYAAKTTYDRLPNAKRKLFESCRHMLFVEDKEQYLQILTSWLNGHDKNIS
ncbi:alpha/beta fold hydrolase [Limosilactobacillus antri]|uniref:alpha/beta fold hydrolase n=1 Tax=Limosilactobacillus antri TaxID=227943 RepID=UPI001F583F9D|nr:hypothetical protein [Limosilactobacillus antri]